MKCVSRFINFSIKYLQNRLIDKLQHKHTPTLYICRATGFSINFEPIIFGHTVFPRFHPVHVDTFTCVQLGAETGVYI